MLDLCGNQTGEGLASGGESLEVSSEQGRKGIDGCYVPDAVELRIGGIDCFTLPMHIRLFAENTGFSGLEADKSSKRVQHCVIIYSQ